jgi:hypothetical protein
MSTTGAALRARRCDFLNENYAALLKEYPAFEPLDHLPMTRINFIAASA